MALKLTSIKADLESENDGAWQEIADWPGVRLNVRSINSKDYQNQRELLVQELIKKLGRVPTSVEMAPRLNKLLAEFILRGWDGIVDDDEKPVIWTPKVGIDYLTNPEYRELAAQVVWAASRVGQRDAEFTVDAVKNSAAPSATI